MIKMKILVVCQYYYPEPFRITDICESLATRGHEVTVLTGLPNYPEGEILKEYRKKRKEKLNGVNVIRCYEIGRGNNKIKLFLNYVSYALSATFRAIFMKNDYDVILVNQLSPVMMGIPAIVYKKIYKKNILLYCLDLWPDSLAAGGIREDSIIYKSFYRLSKWIYSSADSILITSSMFENYFRDVLKLNKIKIKHLPQYAEDLFNIDAESEPETIFSDENKQFNFVFAGNIGDMQSVETIIRAANELKHIENIVFHIVGDGSKLYDCKALSNELNLRNIKFYGRKPIEDMPKYYAMADAMLITLKANKNLSLTLPGKIQSYMATGKPILGAIDGETKRVIEKAACGYISEAENYRALAEIIKTFCNSSDIEQMGKNAYKFYLDNYSKEKFMTVLEDELFSLEGK